MKQGHKQKNTWKKMRHQTCKQPYKTTKKDNKRWHTKAKIASKHEETKDKDRNDNF